MSFTEIELDPIKIHEPLGSSSRGFAPYQTQSRGTSVSQYDVTSSSERSSLEILEQQPRENMSDFPDGGWKAYSVVFGSFVGLIANFGTVNSVGAIQTYVSTHQLAGFSDSTVSWIFSIYLCISFSFGILVGPYFDRKGPFIPFVAGTLLMFGGFMAVASSYKIWHFILSLSICVGIGSAMCITPLVSVVSHWFRVKRGRATGMATIGGSIGGIVIPLMLSSLYPKIGFQNAIRVLACFCLGCMLVAIVLARDRVRNVPKPTDSSNQEDSERKHKKILHNAKSFMDFGSLKDTKYSLAIAAVFTSEISLMMIITYYASYAIKQGMEENKAYILLTIFNTTGVIGRLIPGYFSDIIGHFNVMILMLFGVNLSVFLMWLPFGSHIPVLYAFAAVCGFFSASILSLTPVCLGSITPVEKFGQRYGLLYFFVSMGNLFIIPLAAAIIGNRSKHSYNMFVMFTGLMSILGTCCWIASRYCIVGFKVNVKV